MARHWQPAHDYAVICLAAAGPPAHMVTATAFRQVLGRLALGEPAEALRPRLLVAVRDTVVNWSGTDRITAVLPVLTGPAGGRGMRAAPTLTPENRALTDRSFHGLPRLEQTVLWHTEVEAEPVRVPAGLLGVDTENATAALEAAREKFREGLVRAHRELAPGNECRHHNRLLDIPIRRGGALLPDVQEHLAGCAHCRHAAEQLGQSDAALGVLLAEAVLGWGARRYLDARPGRLQGATGTRGTPRRSDGRRRGGGRPGFLARTVATATSGGRRRAAADGAPGLPGRPSRSPDTDEPGLPEAPGITDGGPQLPGVPSRSFPADGGPGLPGGRGSSFPAGDGPGLLGGSGGPGRSLGSGGEGLGPAGVPAVTDGGPQLPGVPSRSFPADGGPGLPGGRGSSF
ncbi:hypothetical protein ACFVY4_03190, partial [Streptomyces sp. NPDC058299]